MGNVKDDQKSRLSFVIPKARSAGGIWVFADSFCGAVQKTQIPRAKNALGMTIY